MFLMKKSKSMFDMKGDVKKHEKTNLPKAEPGQGPNNYEFNMPFQEYEEDDNDGSRIFMLKTEEKVVRNATDDEKRKLSQEWYDLKDERITDEDADVVIIKPADMRFKSTSDIVSYTECGEPERDQFISLDFTPEEGVDDTKFVLKKCISFWQFIEKHPELQSLRAEPEDLEYEEDSFVSRTPSPISTKSSFGLDLTSCPSSISMLASSWLKKEDLMSSCLATKTELPCCMPQSLEYAEYQLDKPIRTVKKKKNGKASNSLLRTGASKLSTKDTQPSAYTPLDDFSKMMADMRDFDIKHRGVRDPPGHPPSLIHAQMVRNESILPFIKTGRG